MSAQTYQNEVYPGYPPQQQPGMPQQGYPPQQQPGMPQQGYPPPQGYAQPGYPAPQGYAQPPVVNAPAQAGWMAKPDGTVGCPPGLEYLTQIDQLLVHQTVEILEAITNIETKNRYVIKNSAGQQVFYAAEETDFCMRQCCGSQRGFVIHIADNFGKEVMRITRDFKCCAGCCWCAGADCCAHEVVVEAPVGNTVGYVRQSCSFWAPKFEIFDSDHQPIMSLSGPCCICECPCFDVDFNLYSSDGNEIGKINKQWSGIVKEFFADADNFGISFPMDLDVKAKATLLGGVFLVDFMYFEKSGKDN